MQKSSARKCCSPIGGGRRGCRCKDQHINCKSGPKELEALAASSATLTNNVNIMAVNKGGNSKQINSVLPGEKVGANGKNSALTKITKGEEMMPDFV